MDVKDRIAVDLLEGRRRTEMLLAPVDDARLEAQHHPLMSPLVWDYGHIAAYEELWLVQRLSGAAPMDEGRSRIYDAVENPRAVRGSLSLPGRQEVSRYRDAVDTRALALLDEVDLDGDDHLVRDGYVYTMILEHESQHQETILQALQFLPGGYLPPLPEPPPPGHDAGDDPVIIPAGRYPIGTSGHAPWDNEHPRHEVELAAFAIDRLPVSCRAFARFIEDGGYRRPELWNERGWAWITENGIEAPLHWRREGETWTTDRFGHRLPVELDTPVMHVSWHEADAYARWAGRRLPTEFEWEVAAGFDPAARRSRRHPWGEDPATDDEANVAQHLFGAAPLGSYPKGASPAGCEQMIGDVWEWTASDFLPYPGFTPFPYRDYSEAFFGPAHKVLRGGSWATRPAVARVTFRNWDLPVRRQIFAGLRCAASLP